MQTSSFLTSAGRAKVVGVGVLAGLVVAAGSASATSLTAGKQCGSEKVERYTLTHITALNVTCTFARTLVDRVGGGVPGWTYKHRQSGSTTIATVTDGDKTVGYQLKD